MLYCSYEDYAARGGLQTAEDYAVWGLRASRKIDALTMGRAAQYAEPLADELAEACARMADAMRQQEAGQELAMSAYTSESNDGYSISLRAPGELSRCGQARLYGILSDVLGIDPYGLLYRGVCG